MTHKNKFYLSLSIINLIIALYAIFTDSSPLHILSAQIRPIWLFVFVLAILLSIINLAEIIINKDDWNKWYWIALFFNITTLIFVMRFFKISLF
ncbi:hypothetical protein [uncultured Flavobacterium sp.]|uniref:hypothetical protein n=1 Tax=uncultured Flavobacterium sp. TaxID=165435 RepID=UPI0030CA1666